jgi:hypothetical protein
MNPRNISVFKVYQLTSHRTLGYYTGDEDTVITFCSLKYKIEEDDIALERIPVRRVTPSEVVCFREVLGQLRTYTDRIKKLEEEADQAGMREDLVEVICSEDLTGSSE